MKRKSPLECRFTLYKPRKVSKSKKFLFILMGGGAFFVGVFLYFSWQIEKRLAVHRWSIPSHVFSDTVILFKGQKLPLNQLCHMLERRLYRKSPGDPSRPGEYFPDAKKEEVRVWFRRFNFPGRDIPEAKITLKIKHNMVETITSSREELTYWELEPVELTRLFGRDKESRLLISINHVPPYLIDAVLSVEDRRFYDHPGVDILGIIRALWVDLKAQKMVQGGSTITQQLVKNYFLEPERTLKRKILEAIISIILEAKYSKSEILEMYLNEIYMGQKGSVGIYGMGEAARFYLGRNIEDITLSEAALLAGMIRAPNIYNPALRPDKALERRNAVLDIMAQLGKISLEQKEKALDEPVPTVTISIPSIKKAPYFVDVVFDQLKELYDPDVLTRDGLVIYTSLIPEMEEEAETSLRTILKKIETEKPWLVSEDPTKGLQGVIIAVQPQTGFVRSLIGGRDYSLSAFNRATKGKRQVGSTIKPFIYLEAIKKGWTATSWLPYETSNMNLDRQIRNTPCDPLKPDLPCEYPRELFENRPRIFPGRVSLRYALEHSLDIPTKDLIAAVGPVDIAYFLKRLNFSSSLLVSPEKTPEISTSLALGSFEATPMELVSAYTIFPNEGNKPYIITIREVYDAKGEIQQQHYMEWKNMATPQETYIISNMLEGIGQQNTERSLKAWGMELPSAGQAGTTGNSSDSWFVGYTTDMVTLVWLGFDDGKPTGLTGTSEAFRVWALFMDNIRSFLNPQPFFPPPYIVARSICYDSGALATESCPDVYIEYFIERTEPTSPCPFHSHSWR